MAWHLLRLLRSAPSSPSLPADRPRGRTTTRRTLLSAVALLAMSAAGCDDDDPVRATATDGPRAGVIVGQLVKAENGDPLGPFDVSLLDLDAFVPVALTETDSQGVFVFDELAPGNYLPIAHVLNRVLFGLPQARLRFAEPETLRVLYPMSPIVGLQPTDVELSGQVVDAETGDPIAFARVEMNNFDQRPNAFENSPNWSEFRGHASTVEPITDEEGHFRLGPVSTVTFLDPDTMEREEIVPSWRVIAPGYRAKNFGATEFGRFDTVVRVELERGTDTGVLQGRVVGASGMPRPGVAVFAEWRRGAGEVLKSAPGAPLARVVTNTPYALTDADGFFRLEGLPFGAFNLLVGGPGDDGWVGEERLGVEITAAAPTRDVGVLLGEPAVFTLEPHAQAYVVGPVRFRWAPVAEATRYDLVLRRAVDLQSARLTVVDPGLDVAPGTTIFDQPSLVRWEVLAYDRNNRVISATDRPLVFRYDPGIRPAD